MTTPEIRARWKAAISGREPAVAAAAAGFSDLIALMADLRGPAGCPWDREQTLASLRQYVREEADEVCQALDQILDAEAALRAQAGLPPADPTAPEGDDRARTETKGLTIAYHPHRADFVPTASASGAPLPAEVDAVAQAELDKLYGHLAQELGDLLLQSAFIGDILWAMGRGGAEEFSARIIEKLIRRHPHVYGDFDAADSAAVLKNWEKIKQREREEG